MKFPKEEYSLEFFKENDFVRRKCVVCGEYFWTQIPDRNTCGESPCEDYTFINNPPTRRKYSLSEMREAFLSFFEKNNHKRIAPYPIVARWRDDLYFTDASIVDFQPYVTEGIVPPPANPLVISQPCLRFVDIDNVGLTFGRHLTIFEMGGAHAFNFPDREIYWKDDTVRLHHEFVTKELGVKSEEVTYKEGVWSGGGNAGPDVEGVVRGLEVSTLVFMRYKVVGDNQFVELPIRTVDTGYGIERFTWLSQGSVSCFHAIYGELLDKLLKLAGVSVDEKLLSLYAPITAAMRVEKIANIKKLRYEPARKLGMDVEELHRILSPIEHVFAILDHTKALVFMLAEGVVPSNVREGYLSRLVLRRAYRLLRNLRIEDELPEIVEMQIDYWSRDFPHIGEMRGSISRILGIEIEKYKNSLKRGAELTRKICSDLKKKGEREIPLDKLIELYDSHGVPPEIVSEIATSESVSVTVPDDFYAIVARRHLASQRLAEQPITKELEEKIKQFPQTELIYYNSPYTFSFSAKVLGVIDDKHVILNRTAFYAEGGGQPADIGYLKWDNQKSRVVNVQNINGVSIHEVEGPLPSVGSTVTGEIDRERRVALMRSHTATHILLGALRRVLGEHVWQAGAQKGVEKSRLDISHYKRISQEEIEKVELLANKVVIENTRVESGFLPRNIAEQTYGFRLYQGGVVPGAEIRVVKIGDWDVEACGGTHCEYTGELGLIKILGVDRIQDGVERITFAVGPYALKYFQDLENKIFNLSNLFKTSPDNVLKTASKTLQLLKDYERENRKLAQELIAHISRELLQTALPVGDLKLVMYTTEGKSQDFIIQMATYLSSLDKKCVVVICNLNSAVNFVVKAGEEALSRGIHCGELARELAKIIGGGGGGKPDFGQGGGPNVKNMELLIKSAEKLISSKIKSS